MGRRPVPKLGPFEIDHKSVSRTLGRRTVTVPRFIVSFLGWPYPRVWEAPRPPRSEPPRISSWCGARGPREGREKSRRRTARARLDRESPHQKCRAARDTRALRPSAPRECVTLNAFCWPGVGARNPLLMAARTAVPKLPVEEKSARLGTIAPSGNESGFEIGRRTAAQPLVDGAVHFSGNAGRKNRIYADSYG